ncbi:MAG TPA: NosD domain-containing protein [Candidatus Omnitrophota bacterium]|nr:NosD domain-containing protein [Candidatus Omnitrophota bacterium]HPS36720.1 NosD domain-containing protein [Candidatus Omnitrophota bacterium]
MRKKSVRAFLRGVFAGVIFGLFSVFPAAWAADQVIDDTATGQRPDGVEVNESSPASITVHSRPCKRVVVTGASRVFVPLKTQAEWDAFLLHHPAGVVTLSDCTGGCVCMTAADCTEKLNGTVCGTVMLGADLTDAITFTNSMASKTFNGQNHTIGALTGTGNAIAIQNFQCSAGIMLTGNSATISGNTVRGHASGNEYSIVCLIGNNSTISGNSVSGGTYGIFAQGAENSVTNNDLNGGGIVAWGGSNIQVGNNHVIDVIGQGDAIAVSDNAIGAKIFSNVIERADSIGIIVANSSTAEVTGNTILESGLGIWINNSGPMPSTATLTGNTVCSSLNYDIYYFGWSDSGNNTCTKIVTQSSGPYLQCTNACSTPSCTGTLPTNVSPACLYDYRGLTSSLNWQLVPACTDARKCEKSCKAPGFKYYNGECWPNCSGNPPANSHFCNMYGYDPAKPYTLLAPEHGCFSSDAACSVRCNTGYNAVGGVCVKQ